MRHSLRTASASAIVRFGTISDGARAAPGKSFGAAGVLLGASGAFLVRATAQRALVAALFFVGLGALLGVVGLYLFAVVLESEQLKSWSSRTRGGVGALTLIIGSATTILAVGYEVPALVALGLLLALVSLVVLSVPLVVQVQRGPKWPLFGGLATSSLGVLLVLFGDFVDTYSIFGVVLFVVGTGSYKLGIIPWLERRSDYYQTVRRRSLAGLIAGLVLVLLGASLSRQVITLPGAHLLTAALIIFTAAVLDSSFTKNPTWMLTSAGIVAAVASAALYIELGDVWVSLTIAGTAWAVGAWFVFRGEGIIFVVLVGFVVVWGVVDRTTEVQLDANPESQSRILALGDSFMSGEGAPNFFPGTNQAGANRNECRRTPTAYAYLVAERLGMGLDFYACSGATTPNIANVGQMPNSPTDVVGGLAQLDNITDVSKIDVVLVSIGGNDAGFGRIVQGCLLPGSCADRDWFANVVIAGPAIIDAYAAIRTSIPDTPIVAVLYPNLLAEMPCDLVLTRSEQEFLVELIRELNGVVTQAAKAAGVHVFESSSTAFDGRTLCASDPAPNFVQLSPTGGGFFDRLSPANWVHGSMHPRIDGHKLIAERLEPYLRDLLADATPAENPEPDMFAEVELRLAMPTDKDQAIDDARWINDRIYGTVIRALPPLGLLLLAGWLSAMAFLQRTSGLAQLLDPRSVSQSSTSD